MEQKRDVKKEEVVMRWRMVGGGGEISPLCTPKTWAGAHGQWPVVIAFFFSLYTHRGGKVDGLERRRLV